MQVLCRMDKQQKAENGVVLKKNGQYTIMHGFNIKEFQRSARFNTSYTLTKCRGTGCKLQGQKAKQCRILWHK